MGEFNDSGGTGVVWNRAGNSGQLFADVGGFGILLPRTVQLVALILMCNLAHSRCEQMSGAEGNGQTAMWILSALLLAGGGLLESTVKWKMIAGILS